jgi:hypothetical protein
MTVLPGVGEKEADTEPQPNSLGLEEGSRSERVYDVVQSRGCASRNRNAGRCRETKMETKMMKPHLDALETQLLAIREAQGAGALVAAAREAFTAGVAELAACVNMLPEALARNDVAMRSDICATLSGLRTA